MSIDPDEEQRRLLWNDSTQEVSKGMLIIGAILWIVVIVAIAWLKYS